ncbi:MAG: type III pantothenate kinase [Parafilimonas sp.]
MQITLCFDFGNTRLKCAVFENEALKEVVNLEDDSTASIQNILTAYHPQKTILSSVINHNAAIEELLMAQTKFHKLSHKSKLPFTTPVSKPDTIGADRLALCAAAIDMHPQQHTLAISLGSCITYNFINKFHEFLGGSISPGMQMRFNSMHQFTAKLPLINPDANFPLTGYDTRTNLLSGVIMGISKEIDGIIDEYAKRYSKFNVLLTGGDMDFFAPHIKNKIFASPYLIYKGLYVISEFNS